MHVKNGPFVAHPLAIVTRRLIACAAATLVVFAGLSCGSPATAADITLKDKTLVAWVRLANLDQKGAGVLSLGKGPEFDAITFGERVAGRWMAGSHNLQRTQDVAGQTALERETATADQTLFVAIVYRDKQIEIWRDGGLYASYATAGQFVFDETADVLFGLRCRPGGLRHGHLTGAIDEARVYDVALDAETIGAMKPSIPPNALKPRPAGLWTFDEARVRDEMGNFPDGRLAGGARIADGRLLLAGNGYAIVSNSSRLSVAEAPTSGFGMAPNPFLVPRGVRSGDTFPLYTGGRWHLFHMSTGCFGHSSSADLIHWKRHPDTPFDGATGTVLAHEGRYYMFFTGPGQAVSLALSDDLDHWRVAENNPLVTSDGAIYRHGNFRDPYVFYNDEDRCWWMLVGAREAGVSGQRSGCVALAKSKDLLEWELHRPLWAPRIGPHADCPQLIEHDDKWFLFYLQRFTRYRTADTSHGPWQRGTQRNLGTRMAAAGSRAAYDGRRWISWPFLIGIDKNAPAGEFAPWSYGGPLAVPRQWEFGDDDAVTVRPPDEIVRAMHGAKPDGRLPLDRTEVLAGDWEIAESKDAAASKSPSGGSLLVGGVPKNFYLEADVVLQRNDMDARVLFNTNEALTAGYILSLMPDDDHAILRGTSYWDTDRELVQNPVRLEPGRPIKVRVFRTGSIVDIFIDDRATVTHRLFRFSGGSIALEFYDGPGRFDNLFLCELPEQGL